MEGFSAPRPKLPLEGALSGTRMHGLNVGTLEPSERANLEAFLASGALNVSADDEFLTLLSQGEVLELMEYARASTKVPRHDPSLHRLKEAVVAAVTRAREAFISQEDTASST